MSETIHPDDPWPRYYVREEKVEIGNPYAPSIEVVCRIVDSWYCHRDAVRVTGLLPDGSRRRPRVTRRAAAKLCDEMNAGPQYKNAA